MAHFLYLFFCMFILIAPSSAVLAGGCTPTGFISVCTCTTPPSKVFLNFAVGVGGPDSCMIGCVGENGEDIRICFNETPNAFKSYLLERRETCCIGCGGVFTGDRCLRNIEEQAPPAIPSSGCVRATRKTRSGIAASCACAGKSLIDVDFFIARRIKDNCLQKCTRKELRKICRPGTANTRQAIVRAFRRCCKNGGCSEYGTRPIMKGTACGTDHEFGAGLL